MPREIDRTLHNCFSLPKGQPKLQEIPISQEKVEQHLNKANNNLRAMQVLFSHDLFDWVIICGYYSMYHAVLAALFKIGIQARAHYCAIAAFKKFYIERGKVATEYINYIEKAKQLEQKCAEALEKAQAERVVEQYGVEIFTNDDAEWIIEEAKDFVLKIEEALVG